MGTFYALSIWLHLVAATAWVGSMIFFAIVAVPVLRRPDVRSGAPRLLRLLGARWRVLGWVELSILVATGVINLYFRGVRWALIAHPAFWQTSFGRTLAWKLALVTVVVIATLAHDWLAGKRVMNAIERDASSSGGPQARRVASWLGRVVILASLAILFFAAALVRGFL